MIDDEALKNIEKLHEMKAGGIISEEEFDSAKKELLSGRRRTSAPIRLAPAQPLKLPDIDDHLNWMLLPFQRYAQFDGRSGRREFWLFYLLVVAVGTVLLILALSDTGMYGETGALGNVSYVLLVVWLVATAVPALAAEVRRLHDLNRSGWFALLNLVPYVGSIILLVFMTIPGTEGENDYGPDPLA